MINQIDVLLDITGRLDSAGIRYMLTGSFAMNYYAEPRMTRDIDIVIDLEKGSGEKLIELLRNDYYIPEEAVKNALIDQKMFNVIHNQSVIKVDLIIKKRSEYRMAEFERRQKIELNGHPVHIVSIEDLIISKLIWAKDSNSEWQKRDILNLLANDHDREYLKKWLTELGLYSFFQEFHHE